MDELLDMDVVNPITVGDGPLTWRRLREGPIPSMRLTGCDDSPSRLPESVEAALELHYENRLAFHPSFVGSVAPKHRPEGLTYVSFDDFRKELECSAELFFEEVRWDKDIHIELWIPCFDENGGFCFGKSNVWASLLVLPKLAPRLQRVRLMNFGAMPNGLSQRDWLPQDRKVHIVFVDDGIYSGQQFGDVLKPLVHRLGQEMWNVRIHLIVPYVTPRFLLRTSRIPGKTLESLYEALNRLLESARRRRLIQEDSMLIPTLLALLASSHPDGTLFTGDFLPPRAEEKGFRLITAEDVAGLFAAHLPDMADDKEAQRYLLLLLTRYDGYSLDQISWITTHLQVHNTIMMDSKVEMGRNMTSFYFAHKVPDHYSSVASKVETLREKVVPPYRRHAWTFRGRPLNAEVLKAVYSTDLMEYLQTIEHPIAEK